MDPDLRPFSINFDSIHTPRFIQETPLLILNQNERVRSTSQNRSSTLSSLDGHSITNKQPSYHETFLTATPSPPPTFNSDEQSSVVLRNEARQLKQVRLLSISRLILTLCTLMTATAAMGCAGHVLHEYNTLNLQGDWMLHVWPPNIDVKPTIGILVPASLLVMTTLGYLILMFLRAIRSRALFLDCMFACISAIGIILTVFAIVFDLVLVHDVNPGNRESLQSLTCKLYHDSRSFMTDAEALQLPVWGDLSAPPGFKRICVESEAAVALMVALLSLSVMSLAVAGTKIWLERAISRRRNEKDGHQWKAHY